MADGYTWAIEDTIYRSRFAFARSRASSCRPRFALSISTSRCRYCPSLRHLNKYIRNIRTGRKKLTVSECLKLLRFFVSNAPAYRAASYWMPRDSLLMSVQYCPSPCPALGASFLLHEQFHQSSCRSAGSVFSRSRNRAELRRHIHSRHWATLEKPARRQICASGVFFA